MEESTTPEFGGECAFALSTGKKGVAGSEKHRLVQNGKVYLFSNPIAKFLFTILPHRAEKAEETYTH